MVRYECVRRGESLIDDKGMIEKASRYVDSLVEEEIKRGVLAKNIVVGGFSQGGADKRGRTRSDERARYRRVCRFEHVSTDGGFVLEREVGVKVFQAHGTADAVLRFDYGTSSSEKLKSLGMDVQFKSYGGMAHSACAEELDDLKDFLNGKVFS